jgi:hypothetical protein
MPPGLRDRPALDIKQTALFKHFELLSPSRPMGPVGPLAIPISEVEAYCRLYAIGTLTRRSEVHRVISKLDPIFLEYCDKKRKESEEAAKRK